MKFRDEWAELEILMLIGVTQPRKTNIIRSLSYIYVKFFEP